MNDPRNQSLKRLWRASLVLYVYNGDNVMPAAPLGVSRENDTRPRAHRREDVPKEDRRTSGLSTTSFITESLPTLKISESQKVEHDDAAPRCVSGASVYPERTVHDDLYPKFILPIPSLYLF